MEKGVVFFIFAQAMIKFKVDYSDPPDPDPAAPGDPVGRPRGHLTSPKGHQRSFCSDSLFSEASLDSGSLRSSEMTSTGHSSANSDLQLQVGGHWAAGRDLDGVRGYPDNKVWTTISGF